MMYDEDSNSLITSINCMLFLDIDDYDGELLMWRMSQKEFESVMSHIAGMTNIEVKDFIAKNDGYSL